MHTTISTAAAALITVAAAQPAAAAVVIDSVLGGAATGAVRENFDSLAPGFQGSTVLPSGLAISFTPDAGAVQGALFGRYAAPFLSGGNGTGFGPGGSAQANGADTTTYITTGSTGGAPGAKATLGFATGQTYLGLLWGSVDAYNILTFFDGATVVGSVTGGAVIAAANGDQGANGTRYVSIYADRAFDRVEATSSQYAFEFDNVAFGVLAPVPEPASLALFGTALLGLGVARRRARRA